ncbi:MAG: FAD-dependent oxidoreductase [Lacunisphaera sp.]|nr:FAD-dependent oxidoreductase [Lacunisphaera sp.]
MNSPAAPVLIADGTASLPTAARIVIIGGGIVGTSTAFHLTKLGWRDIVLIDQGRLFHNWGSTSHAPGLMFQHNNSRSVCQLASWAIETYQEASAHASAPAFFPVGSIEIAGTRERAEELTRKLGNAKAWGLEAHLIDNAEISRMVPIMRTDDLFGAFHVPSDANVSAALLCEAMARVCREKSSLTVHDHTPVLAIEQARGRVQAVVTPKGRIRTDLVLCAAGIWGPEVGRLAGISIPLTPMQHLYVRTAPLPELKGETLELRHPMIRDQDKDMYYRQQTDAYGFGSYDHVPLPVDVAALPKKNDAAIFPFTPGHMETAFRAAHHRIPCLRKAPIARSFNGLFSFTPDAQSILGEKPELRGFWVAEAVWVTHGGGVGRVMAEWIAHGAQGIDLREMDINRFHPHTASGIYIRERSNQQYTEIYDVIHPLDQTKIRRNLRLPPYHARLQALGAHCFESAGWEQPRWYEVNRALVKSGQGPPREGWAARNWSPIVAAEHHACRDRAGLFDLTSFAKFEVTGPGAFAFLQSITGNELDTAVGRVVYTAMLDERGRIQCDLSVTRLGADRFWIVTGGRMGLHDLAWIRKHAPEDGSVHLTDLTSAYCCVGLWGPRAREILAGVCEDDLRNERFPYLTAKSIFVASFPVLAIRISYVGELGWELYAPTEFGIGLWDTLWAAGQPHGIAVVGTGAFDSLRLEKGYRGWGTDIHTDYNPYEAGLGFAVRLGKKADFIGKAALSRIKNSDAVARRLCCLTLDDPAVALMGKEPIFSQGNVIGYVTSANHGYTVGRSIAYGYLPAACAAEGTKVEIYYFGRRHPATVAKEPLFDPQNQRLRS